MSHRSASDTHMVGLSQRPVCHSGTWGAKHLTHKHTKTSVENMEDDS